MGGGGGRGYLFKLVLGRGASFLGGSNSFLKKIVMGGKPNAPPHKWHAPTWREKTAHIKKYPHRGNSPPPTWIFLFMLHSLASAYIPLACADYDLHSLYSVCLRELEKNQQKLNKNKNFLALSFNFLGGEVFRLYQILRILFIDSISLINFTKRLPIKP